MITVKIAQSKPNLKLGERKREQQKGNKVK